MPCDNVKSYRSKFADRIRRLRTFTKRKSVRSLKEIMAYNKQLTNLTCSGPYLGILALERFCTDLAAFGPYRHDLGPITGSLIKQRRRLRQRQRQKAVILLVKRIKMIALHVRHAFLNISLPYSSNLLREMTKFKVLTTKWTNYRESFSLTLYFKSVCANLVLNHFAHFE